MFEKFFNKNNKGNKKEDLMPLREGALGEQIASGSHTTVYELKNTENESSNLLVKIGETKYYSPPLLKALKISFSREIISKYISKFLGSQFKISPDEDFIKNGVLEYLLMKKYFGYDKNKEGIAVEEQEARKDLMKILEDDSHPFHKEIAKIVGREDLMKDVLDAVSKNQQENFLPKEQVVIGHPQDLDQGQIDKYRDKGKKLPITYYIFQERIRNAVPLYEISNQDLSSNPELLERLLTFSVLSKKMYADTGKLIDTRPEEVIKNPLEWFQKTANILVDKDNQKLFFVDTRWLWDKNSKLGNKWFNLIEWFGARSVNRAIKKYALLLEQSKKNKDPLL